MHEHILDFAQEWQCVKHTLKDKFLNCINGDIESAFTPHNVIGV